MGFKAVRMLPSSAEDWRRVEKAFLKGAGIAAVAGAVSLGNGNMTMVGVCTAVAVAWTAGAFLCGDDAR